MNLVKKRMRTVFILCTLIILLCVHNGMLANFLYHPLAKPFHTIFTQYTWPSRLMGKFADSKLSKQFIPLFAKAYTVDLSEAEKDIAEYDTLNHFFSRKLKNGKRQIANNADGVICPADGNVLYIANITHNTLLPLKQYVFRPDTLFNVSSRPGTLKSVKDLADRFIGGSAFIIRIEPQDYHRYHMPVDGITESPVIINGKYESVKPTAFKVNINPLVINERHLILIRTDQKNHTIAFMPVGALFVSSIINTYTPNILLSKGDELGYFAFGGSTVLLLFEPHVLKYVHEDLIINSQYGKETRMQMGNFMAQLS